MSSYSRGFHFTINCWQSIVVCYLVPGPTPCPEVVAVSYIRPAEVPTLFSVEGEAQVERQNTVVGVMTPPMVGSTWPRVRSTLESECLPALSQGTASFLSHCGLTARYLHCRRAYPMSRDWGCTSMCYRSAYASISSMRPWRLYLYSHARPLPW